MFCSSSVAEWSDNRQFPTLFPVLDVVDDVFAEVGVRLPGHVEARLPDVEDLKHWRPDRWNNQYRESWNYYPERTELI